MPTTQVILTRHAEKRRDQGDDPDLTPEGEARARRLGECLRDLRVPVGAVYCSQLKRTNQTATLAIQAGGLGGSPIVVSTDRWQDVGTQILARAAADELILVVHHANTVPFIAHALGVEPEPAEIDDGDFEQLWTIALRTSPLRFKRGRHPAPPRPAATR
jgi:broad specificity phosphatase PhoE